jgi:hypothetical protein
MAWSWENAGTGAMIGAGAGAPLGPVGMAGGAVVGGVIGGLSDGDLMGDLQGQTNPNLYDGTQRGRSQQQGAFLGKVGNWAMTGQGPSAAQQLVEMNRQQNAANMIGSAKSMPGGNPALANQLASEGIGRGNAAATLQGAQIRSAEQQAMINNWLTGQQAARDADIRVQELKLGAAQKNTEGRQGFLGGLMSGGGGALGGMMG